MSDEIYDLTPADEVQEPIVEITIRSNMRDLGKTQLAARIMRLIQCECKAFKVYADVKAGDLQDAVFVLNTQGPPTMKGVSFLIVDDNGPIRKETTRLILEETQKAEVVKQLPTDGEEQ